ncbi:glycosyltransferase family 39 protein [Candidatus Microgenomates bacterium]|nr:glycosyltransferase family 39 protein [Candidatus Microgenomates bacterium]
MFLWKKFPLIVWLIFIIGLLVRLLYFPQNVYFSFDQARDAFTAQQILKGDFKIIGPPSAASDKLFPGPLIYYIYAPIYGIFGKSPENISLFLRLFNALGILLVFKIGQIIFNRKVGILSALLFAFSYEQSQYALFISHQPLAVIPVLLFYLGLSLLIFAKKSQGLILTMLGWGVAIQFHYVYILLLPILLMILLIFRRSIFPILKLKTILICLGIFLLTTSTYFITEFKFHFRLLSGIWEKLAATSSLSDKTHLFYSQETLFIINRFLHDTFLANYNYTPILWFILAGILIILLKNQKIRLTIVFLLLWFMGGLIPYFLSGTPSYYYAAAGSVSLLIFATFILEKFLAKRIIFQILLILLIIFNNISLIRQFNPHGLNPDMVIQPEMTTNYEKAALDYIYKSSQNQPFAVNGLTIPLNINTTWSYLFEWYGQAQYHYLPVWGGEAAAGFSGNLSIMNDRSKLPLLQFLIIEPTVGIKEYDKQKFFREENYFTKVIEEKQFGPITIQLRHRF